MHSVVIVGGTAAERQAVVEAFGRAQVAATAAETLDAGARPHLLVITGGSAYALVREARLAPHLTDVPILVVLPEADAADSASAITVDLMAAVTAIAAEDSGEISEVTDDAVEEVSDLTSERMMLPGSSRPSASSSRGSVARSAGRTAPPRAGTAEAPAEASAETRVDIRIDHRAGKTTAQTRIRRNRSVSDARPAVIRADTTGETHVGKRPERRVGAVPEAAPGESTGEITGDTTGDTTGDSTIDREIEKAIDKVIDESSGPAGAVKRAALAAVGAPAAPTASARAASAPRPLVAEPIGELGESDEATGEHTRVSRRRGHAITAPRVRRPTDPMALVDALLDAGASDVIRWPVSPRLLRNRAEMLLTVSRGGDVTAAIPSELVRVNDVLTQHGDDAEALVNVLKVVQESLQFERASLIAYIEGSDHGFVIAATDAPTRHQFTLAMAEYPEISHAMKSGAPVLIDDVMTHPLTMRLGAMLAERGVRGSAVLPVQWRGRLLGVILLRRSTPGVGHIAGRGIELAQLVTSITAAHLRHGPVLASLREQTHRISRDRYEAERRLRGIDSLKEHFEAGTDGVVVLDDGGRILFVNRAAERITGFARDGLIGSLLTELASFEQRAQIEDAAAQVLAGTNVAPFDLSLETTQHTPVRVSVSTSTVLAGTGAAIFSFRDVTAERKLENELRSTKEFLERLIDSTVDAIIAADLHGTIILFNQGAERLFGFRAEDMIGKRPVWDLYDKSAARQIMRMLRSNAYGGGGRLDATRREVKIRTGELVPVSMTAAIIYEGGEEVATVGILTDLRERIRMEQRLVQAQRQLQLTEKQALVAELAGAAAHELNQPLTAILGNCELLKRQKAGDAGAQLRAVTTITEQSERMAAIVKKIGKLTKYETTEYPGPGDRRIIDLDRAVEGVIDPVEEGQTGEFTAVLPGGLAAVLGREDFELLAPGGVAAAGGVTSGILTGVAAVSGGAAASPAGPAAVSSAGGLAPASSSSAVLPASPGTGRAARVTPAVAFGSGPAPTAPADPADSAVPSEIPEPAHTSVAMASPEAAASARGAHTSAAPEAELLVDETKPRGK